MTQPVGDPLIDVNTDNGSIEYVTGGIDPIAVNYNQYALSDDGSCSTKDVRSRSV